MCYFLCVSHTRFTFKLTYHLYLYYDCAFHTASLYIFHYILYSTCVCFTYMFKLCVSHTRCPHHYHTITYVLLLHRSQANALIFMLVLDDKDEPSSGLLPVAEPQFRRTHERHDPRRGVDYYSRAEHRSSLIQSTRTCDLLSSAETDILQLKQSVTQTKTIQSVQRNRVRLLPVFGHNRS